MQDYLEVNLDHYCERIEPGLWDEPFNVISNIGFFIAATFLLQMYRARKQEIPERTLDIDALLVLLIAIGVGSSLWHLLATSFTLWADRIPILIFINIYLLSSLFRVLNCRVRCVVAVFALYHVINTGVLLSLPLETFNRSIFYIPSWIFLAALTTMVWHKDSPTKMYYFLATIFFSIAILFRSIDIVSCENIPVGTHFIWHLFVSTTLYFSMLALLHTKTTNRDN